MAPVKALLRPLVGLFLRVPTRRPKLPPGRCYFTSNDMWKRYLAAGIAVQSAEIITSGIDLELFQYVRERPSDGPAIVLFLSRIKSRKGLHTAVMALKDLPRRVILRVVGAVDDKEYLAEVAELGRATGVMQRIQIGAPVEHEDVPDMLAQAHVLVFPTEEPESFSRLVLEAFAVGTPVVGTTLGGTGEVLLEGKTGLTFDPGNAHQLAAQLKRVLTDASFRHELVRNARALVQNRYALGFTVTQIETLLREAAQGAR